MRIQHAAKLATTGSPLENILEGFPFALGKGPIRAILLLLGLVSFVGMPYAVLMPVFADQILHGGARGLGILMGATGIGALLGAASLAARVGVKGLGKLIGFCAGGFGLSLIFFSFSKIFWLSTVLLLPVGFFMMVQMASSNTLIQTMVPDKLRGRIIAVYSMMFMGMAPFGALSAGTVAHHLGAPWTVALGGAACICGSIVFLYAAAFHPRPGTGAGFGARDDGRNSRRRYDHSRRLVALLKLFQPHSCLHTCQLGSGARIDSGGKTKISLSA